MFYGRRHNGGITPDLRYESVGRGFESLPSHQEKPEHACVLVFLFVSTMEGARTGRRRAAPQAISPVGCCLARGFQRVGMSTVEAVNRKISWLFCFVSHGCAVAERVRLISRRFKTERWNFILTRHQDKYIIEHGNNKASRRKAFECRFG